MNEELLQSTFLAIVQGITEFLPISSSAHLILPMALLDWADQGLSFDVAVHLGSLSAVILYFRHELRRMASACVTSLAKGQLNTDSRLAAILLLATIPVAVCGFFLEDLVETQLRSIPVIGSATIVFAILLWGADRKDLNKERHLEGIDWRTGLIVGLAQVLALIPGTSRSGITMTAALFCNLDRETASRFSFLLSIPVIAGAFVLRIPDLMVTDDLNWRVLFYAMLLSAVVAYLCIHYFLKTINAIGFLPFVVYRLLLGLVLFLVYLWG